MVGETRPAVSTMMVSSYLFEHFGITNHEADVRLHEPEDFIVRFCHCGDRDRMLASRPGGAPPSSYLAPLEEDVDGDSRSLPLQGAGGDAWLAIAWAERTYGPGHPGPLRCLHRDRPPL